MIVTIDGPAGAGKSRMARQLARRLVFRFLDTGAMYRAVTLAASECGLDWGDQACLAELARELSIELVGDQIFVDGCDVTDQIRTPRITSLTRYAADNPAVRQHLVELQRKVAGGDDVITEGRDQGTVVFPNAQCKVFLTASDQERARRRFRELTRQGEGVSFEQVLADQQERDERDRTRPVGPLRQAADAIEVCTDKRSFQEVVQELESLVLARM